MSESEMRNKAYALEEIAILLGAAEDWDGAADYLDAIVEIVRSVMPDPGSFKNNDYYRKLEAERSGS